MLLGFISRFNSLFNVFQVTGIEGTYRSTCESVMSVLRGNKDSLMAVLEAFVYDPLLNWRLVFLQPTTSSPSLKKKGVFNPIF
jgi:phosphatidylinositol kinase/protein kinase (PI-3  family)